MALGLLLSAPVEAHPNALRIVAHASETHVTLDTVELRYAVSLPAERHGHAHGRAGQTVEQTKSGLALEGAGPVTWTLSDGPDLSASGAEVVRLVGLAPRSSDALTLHDGNYPDLPGSFRASVTIGPGLDVLSCSLFSERDGEARASRAGTWQLGDGHRAIALSVRRRDGLIESILDRLAPPPPARTAWEARPVVGSDLLLKLTPVSWLLSLLLAAVLARCTAITNRVSLLQLIASCIAATCLATAPVPALVALSAGCIAAAFTKRLPLPYVAALPLAVLQAPGPTVAACLVLLVAATVYPHKSPRRPGVAAVSFLALLRMSALLWAQA